MKIFEISFFYNALPIVGCDVIKIEADNESDAMDSFYKDFGGDVTVEEVKEIA